MNKVFAAITVGILLFPAVSMASVSINLAGGTVTVGQGKSYTEPGYSAFSTVDGDITSSVVVDVPSTNVPGIFTVLYNVMDSVFSSASAARNLIVSGDSGMIYCSGSSAPGWNTTYPDGGCGGKSVFVAYGKPTGSNFGGVGELCPFFQGCMVPR